MPADRGVGDPLRSPWLSLGEASRMLGVTAGTLRRWADAGQVASFVTPGGHRRFPRAVIEGLVPEAGAAPGRVDQAAFTRAYRRRGAVPSRQPAWVAGLGPEDREGFRDRGRALVQLLLDYVEGGAGGEPRLREAAEVAEEYGRVAAAAGASLADTVEGFLLFRSPFLGELARQAGSRGLTGRQATRLLVRAEQAMDRLLTGVMNGYLNE